MIYEGTNLSSVDLESLLLLHSVMPFPQSLTVGFRARRRPSAFKQKNQAVFNSLVAISNHGRVVNIYCISIMRYWHGWLKRHEIQPGIGLSLARIRSETVARVDSLFTNHLPCGDTGEP